MCIDTECEDGGEDDVKCDPNDGDADKDKENSKNENKGDGKDGRCKVVYI